MPWEGPQGSMGYHLPTLWRNSQLHHNSHFSLTRSLHRQEILGLEPSTDLEISSPHTRCATVLNIDRVEQRFLLSGGKQGTLCVHDLEKYDYPSNWRRNREEALGTRRISALRSTPLFNGEFQSISAVEWFPADSGLFMASSYGGRMALFDTNAFEAVLWYSFPQRKIFSAKFHRLHSLHSCIAVGLDDGETVLCDPRVGDRPILRVLTHASGVNALDWHPHEDFHLLTGGEDGAVRLWDIRTAAGNHRIPLMSLDWTNDHTFHVPMHHDALQEHANLSGPSSAAAMSAMPASWIHRGHHRINSVASQAASVVAHSAAVKQATFTTCGRFIFTAGNDALCRLWRADSGQLLPQRYEVGHRSLLGYQIALASVAGLDQGSTGMRKTSTASDANTMRFNSRCPLLQRDEDVFVSPVTEAPGAGSQRGGAVLAIVPLFGSSGRPVRYLRGGHVQGPVTGVCVRRTTGQVLTCAGDGLLLLWQRPVRDTACADEDDEPQADTADGGVVSHASAAPAVHARSSRLLRDDGVESRYDFVRDVLQRRFATDDAGASSSSVSASAAVAPVTSTAAAASSAAVAAAAAVSQRHFRVDVSQTPSQTPQVHVRELESAPRRFLPPILRHYLLQARFHEAHRRQSSVAEPSTKESVDWKAVQAILADANDDDDDNGDGDNDGDVDTGRGKTTRTSLTMTTKVSAPDDVAALFGDVSDSDGDADGDRNHDRDGDGDGARVAGQKRPHADTATAAAEGSSSSGPMTAPTPATMSAATPAESQPRDARPRDGPPPPPARRTGASSGAASGATRRMLQLRRHR